MNNSKFWLNEEVILSRITEVDKYNKPSKFEYKTIKVNRTPTTKLVVNPLGEQEIATALVYVDSEEDITSECLIDSKRIVNFTELKNHRGDLMLWEVWVA